MPETKEKKKIHRRNERKEMVDTKDATFAFFGIPLACAGSLTGCVLYYYYYLASASTLCHHHPPRRRLRLPSNL